MKISIIIPIYNEESNIYKLYERLLLVIKTLQVEYEFIFINDGSKDNSLFILKELIEKNNAVKYISFSRNFGHQVAVSAGLDKVSGDVTVIIDADLQDPPELIIEMYAKLKEGYQVVYAKRKSRNGESFLKKFTAKFFYRLLAKITSVNIPVDTGDFRILDQKVVKILRQMPEQHKFLRGQISWVGFKQTFVEYDRDERNAGQTGYTYKKMIRFAIDGLTSFSNLPLKFATVVGFFVSSLSFILICYALYQKFFLQETTIKGWTSLMISVLFIGGIQLLCIGIIGEYISRLGDNIRNRPLYIIDETNLEP
ncbi:MAG: glycosyltransferase family 2 protein [Bacteroidia bacterium]